MSYLLGCFPGTPLWYVYSFLDNSHYFCNKKKENKEAEAQQLRPVCNLYLNWKLNLNVGFLVCYFEAIEANEIILIASPGSLDKTPPKENQRHSVGLVRIRQGKMLRV